MSDIDALRRIARRLHGMAEEVMKCPPGEQSGAFLDDWLATEDDAADLIIDIVGPP